MATVAGLPQREGRTRPDPLHSARPPAEGKVAARGGALMLLGAPFCTPRGGLPLRGRLRGGGAAVPTALWAKATRPPACRLTD